jgi:hypothetical protein
LTCLPYNVKSWVLILVLCTSSVVRYYVGEIWKHLLHPTLYTSAFAPCAFGWWNWPRILKIVVDTVLKNLCMCVCRTLKNENNKDPWLWLNWAAFKVFKFYEFKVSIHLQLLL